tara:strand:+ start:635 stop:1033 length:399 start_codon:yes stop_codon:yes gene_type:complete
MKKVLLLLVSTCLFISCSKSDDEATSKQNLIGEWNVTAEYEYVEDDENSPYVEIPEPGKYIYEFTERYFTVHTDDPSHIFSGQPMEYTYYPEDGEMTFFGLRAEVDFDGGDNLILIAHESEGRNEVHLERMD